MAVLGITLRCRSCRFHPNCDEMSDDSDHVTRLTQAELDAVVQKHGMFRVARLGGVRAILSRYDLSHLTLRGKDLSHADLTGACLHQTDLREAKLDYCAFFGADMRQANLQGTSLVRADLRGACLRGAVLIGADMSGVDLREGLLTATDDQGQSGSRT